MRRGRQTQPEVCGTAGDVGAVLEPSCTRRHRQVCTCVLALSLTGARHYSCCIQEETVKYRTATSAGIDSRLSA